MEPHVPEWYIVLHFGEIRWHFGFIMQFLRSYVHSGTASLASYVCRTWLNEQFSCSVQSQWNRISSNEGCPKKIACTCVCVVLENKTTSHARPDEELDSGQMFGFLWGQVEDGTVVGSSFKTFLLAGEEYVRRTSKRWFVCCKLLPPHSEHKSA